MDKFLTLSFLLLLCFIFVQLWAHFIHTLSIEKQTIGMMSQNYAHLNDLNVEKQVDCLIRTPCETQKSN